ncbi:MAG: peroxiredoxin-like family protein [Pseudomonadota bacterium]
MSLTIVIAILLLAAATAAALWWYRSPAAPASLNPGKYLPRFELQSEDGDTVSSDSLLGRPAVLLFLRGSWCPFCTEQVRELAAHYRRINELGARLIFVTPKPLDTTRRVADMFEVDFTFWLDVDGGVATELGILEPDAVPPDFRERFGPHAILPTVIVIDKDGVIRFADRARDVRSRPDPSVIVGKLEAL